MDSVGSVGRASGQRPGGETRQCPSRSGTSKFYSLQSGSLLETSSSCQGCQLVDWSIIRQIVRSQLSFRFSPTWTLLLSTLMSSPDRNGEPPDGARVENIKQYYQQLCANYRHISQQLQHPELPPARRQTLSLQLETLAQALQDFTDRVIKPIVNARSSPRPSTSGTGTPSTPKRTRISGPTVGGTSVPSRTPSISLLAAASGLEQPSEGVLLERSAPFKTGGNGNGPDNGAPSYDTLAGFLAARHPAVQLVPGDTSIEELLLSLSDRFLYLVMRGICESARHRKRPGMATRDVELVLDREMGMSVVTAGLPYAVPPSGPIKVPPKKSTSSNPHHARLLQMRRHGLLE